MFFFSFIDANLTVAKSSGTEWTPYTVLIPECWVPSI